MKKPQELTTNDFTDVYWLHTGREQELMPDITRANFQKLVDEHNNLVEVVNSILEKQDISWSE